MTTSHDDEFEFEKDLDIDVSVDLDFDAEVKAEVEKEIDIDIDVYSDVELDGNTAELYFDVQAIGDDTDAQGVVSVLTVEGELSSLSGWFFSAAD
jgi:hypothetical protein